jgi:hypothetical protein
VRDRRSRIDRRRLNLVPEALERFAERRADERRTSPRVPQRLWVVDPNEHGVPQVHEGEIGLGGASWWTRYPPLAERVDVHFRLPDGFEFRTRAHVLRVLDDGEDHRVQVRFTDVGLKDELALARYLESRVRLAKETPAVGIAALAAPLPVVE